MTDWGAASELRRLEIDYERGALSREDYERFRARLGVSAETVPLASGSDPSRLVLATPAVEFASWGRRVAGKVVDLFASFVAGFVLGLVTASLVPTPGSEPVAAEIFVPFVAGIFLYTWLMHGRYGQTLGKMAVGIKIVRGADGGRVSYARAFGRALAEWALGFGTLPLILSYFWPIWDRRRQTLHDKIAGTTVVRL